MNTVNLFRPVGQFEYQLIKATSFSSFPPRLYWQPIFYPVLNLDYAIKIAKDWNTQDPASGYIGYVTSFSISKEYFSQFEVHVVGGAICQELWVPAEELENFNSNILGKIEIVGEFRGEKYSEDARMPEHLRR